MAQAAILLATAAYTANAQNQAGKAQQAISNRNAALEDAQAADAIKRGDEEVLAVRRRTRKLVGSQRTAYAAQGVDIGTGTAVDLQAETEAFGAQDEATVRTNAFREAWGFKTQASNTRFAGDQMRRQGRSQAVGALLGGFGAAYPYLRSSSAGGTMKAPSAENNGFNAYNPNGYR